MKKIILLFALAIFSTFSFAQSKYGVRAGLNVSNLDYEPGPLFGNTHRNGFAIGFFAEYGLSESFSISPEIQFSAEGAKEEEHRLDYIQLPVLFKYHFGDKLSLGAGPMFGLKAWEHEDGYNNFAFSVLGGIEYVITDMFFVDVRYHYGLSNVIDEDFSSLEATNSNIQFGVGIKI